MLEAAGAAGPVVGPVVALGVTEYKRKYDPSKKLEENFQLLESEAIPRLEAKMKDTEATVQSNRTKTTTHSYNSWKKRVLETIGKANDLIKEYKSLGKPRMWNKGARAKLSTKLGNTYEEVLRLEEEGNFPEGFLVDKPPEPVLKLDAPNITEFPTLQCGVDQVLVLLKNDKIKVIGILGVVGVGKTTVMLNLNNHEEVAKLFDIVIWLKVGSEGNEETLRGLIADRLKINVEGITEELKVKKCLFLLDEVMNPLNLNQMGVSESKVVLTTEFLHVCSMSRVIKIHPLTKNEAWKMFQEIVIDVVNLPDIEPYARKVARKCSRLPLLITKVASTFKLKNNVSLWRKGLADLERWPQIQFQGLMEIYEFLKFCYDELDEKKQKCFLYGALYPADSNIYTDYLLECWASEGFLDTIDDSRKYQDVRDEGHTILKHLTDVSLLEKKGERMMYVWMNNCIRQVALHISSQDPESKFLVKTSENALKPTNVEHWNQAKRISMIGSKREDVPENANCGILLTLLLQRNSKLAEIAQPFFVTMTSLLVLDLYSTGIVTLPPSISNLTGLKGLYLNDCRQLTMLPPGIEKLPLEVLDIRGSGVTFIPLHIGGLIYLRCLRMSYCKFRIEDGTQNGDKVDVIAKLTRLEELMIDVISYDEWCNEVADVIRQVTTLKNLTTLRFCFPKSNILKAFLDNSQSWRAGEQITSFRFFVGCQNSKRPEILEFFEYKISRYLKYCDGECNDDSSICNLLTKTQAFELIGHKDIRTLSDWIGIASMNEIRGFLIAGCKEIITILDGKKTKKGAFLHKLEQLYLKELPKLKSIFEGPLPPGSLSRLQTLELKNCPILTKIFSNGVIQQLTEVQKLTVEDCPEIEELISTSKKSGSNSCVLPKLDTLILLNMPKLKTICPHKSLAWPSLEVLKISRCSWLEMLPFSKDDAVKLRAIEGEQPWWNTLQWQNNEVREKLQKLFIPR